MKPILILSLLFAQVIFSTLMTEARAAPQAASRKGDLYSIFAQQIPSGSYQQSCRSTQVIGTTLRGECETRQGRWQNTELTNFHACFGDIANMNAHLTCARTPDVPDGTYRWTCLEPTVNGNTLKARCETRTGSWVDTHLDNFGQCIGDISNQDGHLACPRHALPPDPKPRIDSFFASPSTVKKGETTTLQWNVFCLSGCTVELEIPLIKKYQSLPSNGSLSDQPLYTAFCPITSQEYTYRLIAKNESGKVSKDVKVRVEGNCGWP